MTDADGRRILERLADVASRASGLDLLIVFGSRARGDGHAHSDWDSGYLATPGADLEGWR
jgi:predicted nucleotidyltransferase